MALFQKKLKDPVNGTARVINDGGLKATVSGAIRVPLDLMVEADGVAAHLVHVVPRQPEAGKWPKIGQTLPVVLDRADPDRVKILWDQVRGLMGRDQGTRGPEARGRAVRHRRLRPGGTSSVITLKVESLRARAASEAFGPRLS